MQIQLGENYLITTDKYNWILKEKRVTDPDHHLAKSDKAEIYYVDIGYYGKLEHLIKSLLNKELKGSEVNSVEGLLSCLKQTENKLKIEVLEKVGGEDNEHQLRRTTKA